VCLQRLSQMPVACSCERVSLQARKIIYKKSYPLREKKVTLECPFVRLLYSILHFRVREASELHIGTMLMADVPPC